MLTKSSEDIPIKPVTTSLVVHIPCHHKTGSATRTASLTFVTWKRAVSKFNNNRT